MTDDDTVTVIYDPQCPVCDFYCRRMTPNAGALELVDARNDTAFMPEITAKGWDIDQGMVVKVGDQFYYGSEAIHRLALVSDGRGIVGPVAQLFRSQFWATRLYPILRNARNILLKALGRTRINNLARANNDRF